MKKFAVGFISFYDNDLTIEIVEAKDWRDALRKHSKTIEYEHLDSSLEEAKRDFFYADAMIDVKEV